MAVCLLVTGFGFWAPEGPTRTGVVATGIYVSRTFFVVRRRCSLPIAIHGILLAGRRSRTLNLFCRGISFVYPRSGNVVGHCDLLVIQVSRQLKPREFLLTFSVVVSCLPSLSHRSSKHSNPKEPLASTPLGALVRVCPITPFTFYQFDIFLPIVGWTAILFTLPETKALTLEELDFVFSVPTTRHAKYQLKNATWHVRRYMLFQRNLKPLPPLYETKDLVSI